MKIALLTKDDGLIAAAKEAYEKTDKLVVFKDWQKALDGCADCDLLICDLLATLAEPHKIAGYEQFAVAKMNHKIAVMVPLVVISEPLEYDMDSIVGWPNFVLARVPRPVTMKIFRRISTWV